MSVWLLALIDDVALLLDDAAAMTKISIKKTAWILWDDLAVNAEKASWFASSRELPILWKITKWALLNKIIILPLAFILSATIPWIIPYILILGWIYLAFEWSEKIHEFISEKISHKKHDDKVDIILISEEEKVKSAILTDFILSIEIIILALSTVTDQSLTIQILAVSSVALIATFWVYWLVALLIRMDDVWFYFIEKWWVWSNLAKLWNSLVKWLPIIVKILWIVWTWAMILVAGWIFHHNIEFIHHFYETVSYIPSIIFDTILGFLVWYIFVVIFFIWRSIIKK